MNASSYLPVDHGVHIFHSLENPTLVLRRTLLVTDVSQINVYCYSYYVSSADTSERERMTELTTFIGSSWISNQDGMTAPSAREK
jgi:hypothetical protein